jgi:serine/threonine-protein kinase
MGEVYRALDRKLGREVAIKVLPSAVAGDPARIARFEREARLLASVNHPAIAAIYGAEESDSMRYLVLEFVPGETLTEKLVTGPLSLPETLDLGRQMAEGLEAAHEKGIVHRDLKPANVKVTPEGKVKILDLGLAKALDVKAPEEDNSRSPTADLDQTRPGMILGTVEFMSPEQARGKAIDKRTDIWAFGCILYEMLSGRRAFTGETLTDVLATILHSEPDWSALPRQTPERVRELLGRCFQKDPNRRLRDIGDARNLLEEALAEREGRSSAGIVAATARPERRLLRAATAAVVLALAATAVWLAARRSSQTPVPKEKYLAVLPFKDLSGSRAGQLLGDALVETVSARLAKLPDLQVVTPSAAVAAADKQADPFRAAHDLGANLILRGSVQQRGDRVRITYSIWNAQRRIQVAGDTLDGSASEIFGMQDRLAERVAGLFGVEPRRTPKPSGLETAADQSQYLQSLGHLQRHDKPGSTDEAIRLLEKLASDRPSAALVQAALGRAYLYKFEDTREESWVPRAEAAFDRAEALDPDLPEVHITLGKLKTLTGRAREAIAAFDRALAVEPNNYQALLGLAAAFEEIGDARQAEETYSRAIRLQPAHWSGYNELAAFFARRGRYAEAVETFRRVTELTPDNPVAFSNLGATYALKGDFQRALQAYRRSLALAPTDVAHSNLGTTQFYLGRYDEAAESFAAAVRLTPGHFQLWANLGDAYRWTKGLEPRAAEAYRRAIELARGELRVNPKSALAHSYIALCLAKTDRRAEAEQHARRSLELEPTNPELLYNAAIVARLGEKHEEAVELLRRAIRAGYSRALVERDPELAGLRRRKDFATIADEANRKAS